MIDLELIDYLKGFLTQNRLARFERVLDQRTRDLTVVSEDVYHLHNTSAIIRSCDVFGIQDVHVIEDRFGKQIDKEIALGAQKWVDVYRYNNTNECLRSLKEKGYQIVCASVEEQAKNLELFEFNKPTALCFGSEKQGLSDSIKRQADGFLKVPMVGFSESLNVSVAAAIMLNRLTHKLKLNPKKTWQLSLNERQQVLLSWLKVSIKDSDFIERNYYENR